MLESRDIREVDEELGEVTQRRRRGAAQIVCDLRAREGTISRRRTCTTVRHDVQHGTKTVRAELSCSARASLVGKQQIADGRKTVLEE